MQLAQPLQNGAFYRYRWVDKGDWLFTGGGVGDPGVQIQASLVDRGGWQGIWICRHGIGFEMKDFRAVGINRGSDTDHVWTSKDLHAGEIVQEFTVGISQRLVDSVMM